MNRSVLNSLISSLKLIEKDFENPNYFEEYHNLVCQIGELKEPDSISLLVQFLEDDAEELNLMWAIIHTIEIFDNNIYIKEILKISSYIYKKCPEWTLLIFMRILNSKECKIELIRQLRESPLFIKQSVENIMEEINRESPEFLVKTTPVTIATKI